MLSKGLKNALNKIKEILEINLINGKYYVQFTNSKSLYKISFNIYKIEQS